LCYNSFLPLLCYLRNALAMLELGTSEAGAHGTWSLVSHWGSRDTNPQHFKLCRANPRGERNTECRGTLGAKRGPTCFGSRKQPGKKGKKESITMHAPCVRSQAGWLGSMMQGMRWKLFGHCCWFTGISGKGRRNNCIYIAVPHAPRKSKHRPAGVYA
jgi:hypothetical protein